MITMGALDAAAQGMLPSWRPTIRTDLLATDTNKEYADASLFRSLLRKLQTGRPITIIGEAFRSAWEKKELLEVQVKIQLFLRHRNLSATELHEVFREFDTSGDSQLDWAEFKGALKKLGIRVPVAKMRSLFSMFDEDETGEVRF